MEILRYLHQNGYKVRECIFYNAINNNNFEMFNFLIEKGCKMKSNFLVKIAR